MGLSARPPRPIVARLLLRLLLGRRLPVMRGSRTVSGITAPVTVRRDRWGIPHIDAASATDAWFGLGFCQGQDRAFQLEFLLRIVRGTLAELVGPDGLPFDRLSRRVGFLRSAREQLDALDPDIRAMVEAFAAGATAGATRGLRRRPHEFVLLRAAPTGWTGADVVGVMKVQSFVLGSNWSAELIRLKILTEDGPEALAALDPSYPEWHPATAPPGVSAGPAAARLAQDAEAFLAWAGGVGGSNNWALASARTATGRPLVANDPHLAPLVPSHWYLAHVRTPSWAVAGAAFVGAPGFPVGHNEWGAWGVTIGNVDNTDLFVEEIGADGRSVREGDAFVPCQVLHEPITVRGAGPVVEEVLITARGPIVGPALEGEMGAVSMRALWLDPRRVRGLFDLYRVQTVEEFRRSLASWPAPSLNVVFANRSGDIAWQLCGQAPRRRKGWGLLPLPGSDPGVGWEPDLVPFEEMPFLINPPGGFVATANNQPTPEGTGPFLGADWADGYRLTRILEALTSRKPWDLQSSAALQMDVHTQAWREIRRIVLAAPDADPAARAALDLLRAWDGRVAADSPAAAVYELFVAEMARRVVAARAPRSVPWALGRGFSPLTPFTGFGGRRVGHLAHLLRTQPPGWFARPWPEEIADALGAALGRLRAEFGGNPKRWGWGRVRPLTLRHPLGARRPLGGIFNLGPIPWGGDSTTPAQASVSMLDPTATPGVITSLRAVMDVGAWDNCRFVLPGGQSGNPLSPHYDDQLPLWRSGGGIPIPWSDGTVKRTARRVLRLLPS